MISSMVIPAEGATSEEHVYDEGKTFTFLITQTAGKPKK
jgi:hypothetical protein